MDVLVEYLYKYVNYEGVKDILQNMRIRFTSVRKVNDRIDIYPETNLNFENVDFYNLLIEKHIRLIKSNNEPPNFIKDKPLLYASFLRHRNDPNLSPSKFADTKQHLLNAISNYLLTINKSWKDNRNRMYLLCLTELCNDNYMWNEYANNHTGAVVKFRQQILYDNIFNPFMLFDKVIYDDDKLYVATLNDMVDQFVANNRIDVENVFKKYAFTKKTKWSNEKEWRYVWEIIQNDKKQIFYRPINEKTIDCVYIGKNMDRMNKDKIVSISNDKNIQSIIKSD